MKTRVGRELKIEIASFVFSFKEIVSVKILVLATLLVSMVMFVSAKHLVTSCTWVVTQMTACRMGIVFLCGQKLNPCFPLSEMANPTLENIG